MLSRVVFLRVLCFFLALHSVRRRSSTSTGTTTILDNKRDCIRPNDCHDKICYNSLQNYIGYYHYYHYYHFDNYFHRYTHVLSEAPRCSERSYGVMVQNCDTIACCVPPDPHRGTKMCRVHLIFSPLGPTRSSLNTTQVEVKNCSVVGGLPLGPDCAVQGEAQLCFLYDHQDPKAVKRYLGQVGIPTFRSIRTTSSTIAASGTNTVGPTAATTPTTTASTTITFTTTSTYLLSRAGRRRGRPVLYPSLLTVFLVFARSFH